MAARRGIAIAAFAVISAAAPAHAGDNDIVLARLGKVRNDATGTPNVVVGQNLEFRALVSELGVVLAPELLTPSDTLGFGGFQFTADVSYTTIDNKETYWRVLAPVTGPDGSSHSGVMPTIG